MMPPRANGAEEAERAFLAALAADERLWELGRYVPPLSLPRIFGVARHEVAHSHVLGELLDPARHAGATGILRPLLREVADRIELEVAGERDREAADKLRRIADGSFERVEVRRESMLIDVVVEVLGDPGEAVIGIENKIDAGEQTEQISRYQATLERAYPGRAAAIVFLTPTGRRPSTASADSLVPVVALDYGWLASVLTAARRDATAGRDRRVLAELEEECGRRSWEKA